MKILIAENEPDIIMAYKTVLEDRGHEVILTEDGQECISIYRKELKRTKTLAYNNHKNSNKKNHENMPVSGLSVENNSSRQVYFVQVVSVLYDQRGNIITTGVGMPQLGTLKPGEHSAFSITISIPINEAVGRFLVIPGGNFY